MSSKRQRKLKSLGSLKRKQEGPSFDALDLLVEREDGEEERHVLG